MLRPAVCSIVVSSLCLSILLLVGVSSAEALWPPPSNPAASAPAHTPARSLFERTADLDQEQIPRIQKHLEDVQARLRARDVSHLSPARRAERSRLLDRLGEYSRTGLFPRNLQSTPTPVFIDHGGRHCAVGDLMHFSGAGDLARGIADTQNTAYVPDLNFPGLTLWIIRSGLTVEECAMIQPTYDDDGNPAPGPSDRPARAGLDLPSGGYFDEQDPEDPIDSIAYIDTQLEGDSFVFCLDRSGSMAEDGKLQALKAETISAIQQLSSRSRFSIVSFSSNVTDLSARPLAATISNKQRGITYVQSLGAGGWTCLEPAAIRAIDISRLSDNRARRVLIVCDGLPLCFNTDTTQQCLENITAMNHAFGPNPIDTFFVGSDPSGLTFMQQLASLNGGTFTQVD